MNEHDRLRDMTAAYVVGALAPDERDELVAHLEGCERCRDEVVAFAPLPSLLARLDVDELTAEPGERSADDVVAAVRAQVRALAASRRRWRVLAGIAAAVAVLAGGAVLLDDDPSSRRSGGVPFEVETAAGGAEAHIVADERSWGTYVHVSAEGLPPRSEYALWLIDSTGRWHPAGTFAPTPDGSAQLGGSSRLRLASIDRVVITSADKADELVTAT